MNIVEPIRDTDKIKEIHSFLQEKNSRDALLFSFGIYTGLRISDILNYKVKDFLQFILHTCYHHYKSFAFIFYI